MRRLGAIVPTVALLLCGCDGGCSGEKPIKLVGGSAETGGLDAEQGDRWACHRNPQSGDCMCVKLRSNAVVQLGAHLVEVDSCSDSAKCFMFSYTGIDERCGCGAEGYVPDAAATNVAPAERCPPWT